MRTVILAGLAFAACDRSGPLGTPPAPIPPPPDPCAPFAIQYTSAGAGGPDDCPVVDCNCNAYAGPVPSPRHGCVQSVDCSAACASEGWLTCALESCASDADCGQGGDCLLAPGAIEGLCQTSGPGAACIDVGDCQVGERCVAFQADGSRGCIDPSQNDRGHCNVDADCPATHCARLGASFLGLCSAGDNYAFCFSDGDCASGLRCKKQVGDQPGWCSDGADGSPCERTADCRTGICAWGSCSAGNIDDYCEKNGDCRSGFCSFGVRCTDGAVDAECAQDDQCATGRCAGNAAMSACTTGAPSAKCVDDQDCVDGVCQHPEGLSPLYVFGSCN
jgi:hypothetical protein